MGDELEEVKKIRTRTITKNIGNDNDLYITFKEIMNTIYTLKLNSVISSEEAHNIFSAIDTEKKGKVKKSLFIAKLEEANKEDLSYKLFLELNKNYSSKCEKIIQKLKNIKNHNKLLGDIDIQKDLTWIINTIINEDIYEPEIITKFENSEHKDLFGLITTVESNQMKLRDLETVAKSVDKYKTRSFISMKKQRATMSDCKQNIISSFAIGNDIFAENFSNLRIDTGIRKLETKDSDQTDLGSEQKQNNSGGKRDRVMYKTFTTTFKDKEKQLLKEFKQENIMESEEEEDVLNLNSNDNTNINTNNNTFTNEVSSNHKDKEGKRGSTFHFTANNEEESNDCKEKEENNEDSNKNLIDTQNNNTVDEKGSSNNLNNPNVVINFSSNLTPNDDITVNTKVKSRVCFDLNRRNNKAVSLQETAPNQKKIENTLIVVENDTDKIQNEMNIIDKLQHESLEKIKLDTNNINDISSIKIFNVKDQICMEANDILTNLDDFEFDIFELDKYLKEKTLYYITYEVFCEKGYFDNLIKEKTFNNVMEEVSKGYNRNIPYHNDLHAGDVFQTVFLMFTLGDLEEVRSAI